MSYRDFRASVERVIGFGMSTVIAQAMYAVYLVAYQDETDRAIRLARGVDKVA